MPGGKPARRLDFYDGDDHMSVQTSSSPDFDAFLSSIDIEDDRSSFSDLEEDRLYIYTVDILELSWAHRESPFHFSHDLLSKVMEEWRDRNAFDRFTEALESFDDDLDDEEEGGTSQFFSV